MHVVCVTTKSCSSSGADHAVECCAAAHAKVQRGSKAVSVVHDALASCMSEQPELSYE